MTGQKQKNLRVSVVIPQSPSRNLDFVKESLHTNDSRLTSQPRLPAEQTRY